MHGSDNLFNFRRWLYRGYQNDNFQCNRWRYFLCSDDVFDSVHNNGAVCACISIYKFLLDSFITWRMYRDQLLWYHRLEFKRMYRIRLWKEQIESFHHWNSNVAMVTTLRLLASTLIVIIEIRGAANSRGWSRWLSFSYLKQWQYKWQFMTMFSSMPCFYSTHVPMIPVLDSLLEFTNPLLSS